jgi:hypothetical protein
MAKGYGKKARKTGRGKKASRSKKPAPLEEPSGAAGRGKRRGASGLKLREALAAGPVPTPTLGF